MEDFNNLNNEEYSVEIDDNDEFFSVFQPSYPTFYSDNESESSDYEFRVFWTEEYEDNDGIPSIIAHPIPYRDSYLEAFNTIVNKIELYESGINCVEKIRKIFDNIDGREVACGYRDEVLINRDLDKIIKCLREEFSDIELSMLKNACSESVMAVNKLNELHSFGNELANLKRHHDNSLQI